MLSGSFTSKLVFAYFFLFNLIWWKWSLECWCVLLDDHLCVFNWDFWAFLKITIERGMKVLYCVETLTPKSIPQNSCFFHVHGMVFRQQPIELFQFPGQNDRVPLSGRFIYKTATRTPCHIKLSYFFSNYFTLIHPICKNHNLFNFDPKFMGFFVLCSSWSLLFYHIFSRIFGCLVFKWP